MPTIRIDHESLHYIDLRILGAEDITLRPGPCLATVVFVIFVEVAAPAIVVITTAGAEIVRVEDQVSRGDRSDIVRLDDDGAFREIGALVCLVWRAISALLLCLIVGDFINCRFCVVRTRIHLGILVTS